MQRVRELWDLPQMVTQRGASTPDSLPACSRTVSICTKSLRPDDIGALVALSPLSCLSLPMETPRGSQCSGLLLGRLAWPQEQTVAAHTVPHWRCSSFMGFPVLCTVNVFFCRHSPPSQATPCRFHIITLEMCFQEDLLLVTCWNKCSQSPSLPRSGFKGQTAPCVSPQMQQLTPHHFRGRDLRGRQPPTWPHKWNSAVPGLRAPAPSSVGKVGHTVHTRGQLLGEPETRSHPPSGGN